MNDAIPSMWREELYHPMVVHFPIALLTCATCFSLLAFHRGKLGIAAKVIYPALLTLGVLGAWIAIYTGNISESVVNRVICDPTVTHKHGDLAWLSSYFFSAALLFELLQKLIAFKDRAGQAASTVLKFLVFLLMCTGVYFLVRSSHLGATLVYQQSAATYRPSPECSEFAD